MDRWTSLRFRVLGFLAVLAIVIVVRGLIVAGLLDDLERQRRQADIFAPASADLRALSTALVDQETGERGYLITGDRSFLEPYARGQLEETRLVASLRSRLVGNEDLLSGVSEVAEAADEWRRVGPIPEITALESGDRDRAERLVAREAGRTAFDEVRGSLEQLQTAIDRRLRIARADADAATTQVRVTYYTTAVGMLLLVVAGAFVLRRWVLGPIEALRSELRGVTDGDLERPISARGPSEVRAIGEDAEAMRVRILAEVEAARSATEALEQEGPVVAGLRRELQPSVELPVPGIEVQGVLLPAEGVLAGDWWDAAVGFDGSFTVVVADIGGHGAGAGLVAARLKQRLMMLLRVEIGLEEAFAQAVADLEQDADRILTCLIVCVLPETGELTWLNAGHVPAIVIRAGENGDALVEELDPTGPLVGVGQGEWTLARSSVGPDDVVILLTDGITEARSGGEEFGVEGVLAAVESCGGRAPAEIVDTIVAAARAYADDWRRDDVTCVAVRIPA